MTTLGRRRRTQGPPPRVVFEAITQPHRRGARAWLFLTDDEQEPRVLEADPPHRVLWSSLWPDRPDDTIRLGIDTDGHGGSSLEWELVSSLAEPTEDVLRHLRRRLNELLNRDLRESFDA